MGSIEMSQQEVDALLTDIGGKYTGRSYNLLFRNCNHFSEELVQILCAKPVPGWINRLALLGILSICSGSI